MKLLAITSGIAATSVICVRVRNLICRNRCRINCVDQLLCLRTHCGCQQCRLAILGCSASEIIVFSLEGRNLLVAQVVQNSSGSGVLAVDNVSGVAVHGVLQCTGVLCHIVVHTLDCFTGLTAAISKLCLERVCVLHIGYGISVNGLLNAKASLHDVRVNAVESGKHTVVHGVEAITQAVGNSVKFTNDSLIVEATLDCAIGVSTSGRTVSTIAPSIVTPSAEYKQKQDNNPPCAVAAPHDIVVTLSDCSRSNIC